MASVLTGLDVVLRDKPDSIFGRPCGVITNRSALTSAGEVGLETLLKSGLDVRAVFAPEHGLGLDLAAGEHVPAAQHASGLTVHSLHGETKSPTPEMLEGLEVLVFDIQDVGARFYTYLYTMAYAMQAAAEVGLCFVVLDRPNPINGVHVEGPVLEQEFASFVGLYPLPVRTGMTIGETASLFNTEFRIGCELGVVRMEGWEREMWYDDTGLPWSAPSPNIPDLETAALYPGTCLVEGTNLSEGRWTDAPLKTIGAPWVNAQSLARDMNLSGLRGVSFEACSFTPAASKFAGECCQGIRIVLEDRNAYLPVLTGVKIIETTIRLYPGSFEFLPPGLDGRRFFDLLAGTEKLRLAFESHTPAEQIAETWDNGPFDSIRRKYLLY